MSHFGAADAGPDFGKCCGYVAAWTRRIAAHDGGHASSCRVPQHRRCDVDDDPAGGCQRLSRCGPSAAARAAPARRRRTRWRCATRLWPDRPGPRRLRRTRTAYCGTTSNPASSEVHPRLRLGNRLGTWVHQLQCPRTARIPPSRRPSATRRGEPVHEIRPHDGVEVATRREVWRAARSKAMRSTGATGTPSERDRGSKLATHSPDREPRRFGRASVGDQHLDRVVRPASGTPRSVAADRPVSSRPPG